MKALVIGGERHGEFVDVLNGVQAWVDIRSASTYRVRKLGVAVMRPADQGMEPTGEAYQLILAVHPDLTGPNEPVMVQQILQAFVMNDFARRHGEPLNIPDDQGGIIVPQSRP